MLFRNTLAQMAPTVAGYMFSLLLAPLMLSRLGLTQFGVWAVTGAIAAYAGLLEMGISYYLARYVALYDAQGEPRKIAECLCLGLIIVLGVAVLGGAILALGAPLLADSLDVADVGDMRLIALCALGILVANSAIGVINAVPVGLRRMVPPNVLSVAGSTVNFGASVAVLVASTELTHYALANLAAAGVALLLAVGGLLYVWKGPFFALPSVAHAREVVAFSIKGQVIALSDLVNQQTDKIIIAVMVGPRAAGTYEIANRVAQAVRSVGVMSLSAMIPTATAEIVERGRRVIREYYGRYTQRTVAVAFPLFAMACVGAPFLLVAWLGEAPGESPEILVLLSAAFFVNMATGVAMTLATSDGRPGIPARASALTAGLNVVATLALAPLFGLWGVLVGTFIAVTVGSTLFLARFHRFYELPASDLRRAVLPTAALALGLAAPFVAWHLISGPDVSERPEALVGLAVTALPYGLFYWMSASRLGFLPEQLTVGSLLRRLGRRPQPA